MSLKFSVSATELLQALDRCAHVVTKKHPLVTLVPSMTKMGVYATSYNTGVHSSVPLADSIDGGNKISVEYNKLKGWLEYAFMGSANVDFSYRKRLVARIAGNDDNKATLVVTKNKIPLYEVEGTKLATVPGKAFSSVVKSVADLATTSPTHKQFRNVVVRTGKAGGKDMLQMIASDGHIVFGQQRIPANVFNNRELLVDHRALIAMTNVAGRFDSVTVTATDRAVFFSSQNTYAYSRLSVNDEYIDIEPFINEQGKISAVIPVEMFSRALNATRAFATSAMGDGVHLDLVQDEDGGHIVVASPDTEMGKNKSVLRSEKIRVNNGEAKAKCNILSLLDVLNRISSMNVFINFNDDDSIARMNLINEDGSQRFMLSLMTRREE